MARISSIVFLFLLFSVIFSFNKISLFGSEQGYWVNSEYSKCLVEKLPCECQKDLSTYFSLFFTKFGGKDQVVWLSKQGQNEPYSYPVKMIGLNKFLVLENKKDTLVKGQFEIIDDTLHLNEEGYLSKFIFKGASGVGGSSINTYNSYFHHQTLNEMLLDKGYEVIEDVVGENDLWMDCSNWMGGVNLLYSKTSGQAWLLEVNKDLLNIKVIKNIDDDPDAEVVTEGCVILDWKRK